MKNGSEKIIHSLALVVALFAFSGCETTPPPPKYVHIPFEDEPFKPYLAKGTAKITGQAFLKTRGGDVKTGAGNTVELIPAVGYFKTRMEVVITNGEAGPRDPRLTQYIRTTTADAMGNFEFTDLPAGKYMIVCMINWEVPQVGFYGSVTMTKTGGQAIAAVTIEDGETKRVIATR